MDNRTDVSGFGAEGLVAFDRDTNAVRAVAVAVFGVYFKLQSFIFLPVFGLNNGMVPILAYNYGAGKPERILKTVKLSMLYAMVLMAVGVLVFQIFPVPLLKIFRSQIRSARDFSLA